MSDLKRRLKEYRNIICSRTDNHPNVDSIGIWIELFLLEIGTLVKYPKNLSTSNMSAQITPELFKPAFQSLRERMKDTFIIRSGCTQDDMLAVMYQILSDVIGVDPENYSICSSTVAWNVVFALLQIWQKCRHVLTIIEIIHIYNESPFQIEKCGIKYSDNKMADRMTSGGLMKFFFAKLFKSLPSIELGRHMWELWYENDPAVNKEGIGNLTVWLPREMVEDILNFLTSFLRHDEGDIPIAQLAHTDTKIMLDYFSGWNE